MKVALLCATHRGLLVLQKLASLLPPHTQLLVVSFREERGEPPFLNDIRAVTQSLGAEFIETKKIDSPQWTDQLTSVDLMLVVSWRYLIPSRLYEKIPLGVFVFHDSLLPAYRGFSPTVWAIINGESYSGVTLFKISQQFDAGDIVAQRAVRIGVEETIADMLPKISDIYLQLLQENLEQLLSGSPICYPQDHAKASFTCKRLPQDNLIDWNKTTFEIYNLIRGVTRPYAGAFTFYKGKKLIIWKAKPLTQQTNYIGRISGRVVGTKSEEGAVVLTGDGALIVTEVQLEGDTPRNAIEVLSSLSLTLGN